MACVACGSLGQLGTCVVPVLGVSWKFAGLRGWGCVCVCVCACVRARACVCACVCVFIAQWRFVVCGALAVCRSLYFCTAASK